MVYCTGLDVILFEFRKYNFQIRRVPPQTRIVRKNISLRFSETFKRYSTESLMLIPNMCVLDPSLLGRKHTLMALVLLHRLSPS